MYRFFWDHIWRRIFKKWMKTKSIVFVFTFELLPIIIAYGLLCYAVTYQYLVCSVCNSLSRMVHGTGMTYKTHSSITITASPSSNTKNIIAVFNQFAAPIARHIMVHYTQMVYCLHCRRCRARSFDSIPMRSAVSHFLYIFECAMQSISLCHRE